MGLLIHVIILPVLERKRQMDETGEDKRISRRKKQQEM